jgi:hypothetical protein
MKDYKKMREEAEITLLQGIIRDLETLRSRMEVQPEVPPILGVIIGKQGSIEHSWDIHTIVKVLNMDITYVKCEDSKGNRRYVNFCDIHLYYPEEQ